ncbi:MAG: MMPL family transporter [Alphaproteobacteria bacterium]|nr:MMPL family transporter [Alphaproteobacteria bacterium]
MINLLIRLVENCRRKAWAVIALYLLLAGLAGGYAATHFRMNTDVNTLLAADLPWRQQEKALENAFPQRNDLLVVVIDGETASVAESAASKLFAAMSARPELFQTLQRPDALPFFRQNGLLYLEQKELADLIDRLMQAQPLLGTLAADQSLRGLFRTFGMMLTGVEQKVIADDQYVPTFKQVASIITAQHAGQAAKMDWGKLIASSNDGRALRRFILTQPVLDYAALSPGAAATEAVRAMVKSTDLDVQTDVKIRLTGSVALNDEEFASVADGMGVAALGSLLIVATLLILALRSLRLVVPILMTLTTGLMLTTAAGLAMLGALNLISVAFAVMFIGIAVDFGIQFGVRFRDQHFHYPDQTAALRATTKVIAAPLSLAAASTAAGFFAFTPTAYAGVAELGLIAGTGMIIALICNLTLLPALLTLCSPPAEREAVGFRWTRPLDDFLHKQRKPVMALALLLALSSGALATQLRFDFDPLNLKDPKVESVATLFDLAKNLDSTPYTAQILAPNQSEADALAAKLRTLPQVARVMTLSSFIPEAQESKLDLLHDTQMILLATLAPTDFAPAPKADDLQTSAKELLSRLDKLRDKNPAIAELAEALRPLSMQPEALFKLQDALVGGLPQQLIQIRDLLGAQPVTLATLPDELRRDWATADGHARLEIYPAINPRDPAQLLTFNAAVQAAAPQATGTTIAIAESGHTVVHAFQQAALGALAVIALLLLLCLRRVFDVLALLAPLLLAGLLTLATCVLLQVPVNFANIIGLPLLLGLGVSFAIYFVSYWRDGGIDPLQSSMARAVCFSAATTLVAFGSLAMSAHPGTASMGKILTIALIYALGCTCFLLPALLRQDKP